MADSKVEVVLTPNAEPTDADHAALQAMLPRLAEQYTAILGESVSVCVGPSEAERLLLAIIEKDPADYRETKACACCYCDLENEEAHDADCAIGVARCYLMARGLLPVTP